MSDADITSVAALISVILRRKAARIIDVKWLVKNQEYAHEIIQLSREQGQQDLTEYANHLEQLMFGSSASAESTASAPKASALMDGIDKLTKYAAELSAAKNKPFIGGMDNSSSNSGKVPKLGDSTDGDGDGDGEVDSSKYVGHLR